MKLVLVNPTLSYLGGDNVRIVRELLGPLAGTLSPGDVALLPEHHDLRPSRAEYEADVIRLARTLGCHVVGGSQHAERDGRRVNAGIVVASDGAIVGEYEKIRPYADERTRVDPGTKLGEVAIAGLRVLVLLCADFWFSDLFHRAASLPDLVLVPALSVTRKPHPGYSRALWQHLSVARAYEFGAYVGVSDWAEDSRLPALATSGVAGLADPTATEPSDLFVPVGGPFRAFDLDLDRLGAFRRDRASRGFFWKAPG